MKRADVVVAPTVNYHYYPAFVDYPGSITIRLKTARDLMVDICRSLARYGPRKFYVLNTGLSTLRELSARILADEGVQFRYTDMLKLAEPVEAKLKQEEGGTHADEIETSIMLRLLMTDSIAASAPEICDKAKALRPLRWDDLLIVSPLNAPVSDLWKNLPKARVGTVDKFQGQQAPVVIYSMATSSPEDAPQGMEFLYSLNRLNVATSRAQAMVIVVGNPRLLEPECRNPRQMRLANALCRYVELAQIADLSP